MMGRRDLLVANTGGYLTAVDTAPRAVDVLRPWSVTARAGLTFIENFVGNFEIPRAVTAPAGTWVSTETTAPTAGSVVVGLAAFVPRVWIGTLKVSRLFLVQGGARAEDFVRTQMLRACGHALDVAVLNGSGAADPVGLLNHAGVASVSGTALSHAGTTAIQRTLAANGLDDERIQWVAAPTVREALQSREIVADTGRMIWADDRVLGRPAVATADMPAASLLAGDFSQCAVALWGAGIQLDVAHADATDFASGVLTVRVLVAMDTGVLQPGGLIKSTTVS